MPNKQRLAKATAEEDWLHPIAVVRACARACVHARCTRAAMDQRAYYRARGFLIAALMSLFLDLVIHGRRSSQDLLVHAISRMLMLVSIEPIVLRRTAGTSAGVRRIVLPFLANVLLVVTNKVVRL